MSKKLLLVRPKPSSASMWDDDSPTLPPYGLVTVASQVPDNWKVEIVDEWIEPLTYKEEADLVGITSMVCWIPKASEISKRFRERNIPVILGGFGSVACNGNEEFSSIVRGEAESALPELLKDFEQGRLKKVYIGKHCEINPKPARYDLLSRMYSVYLIQTSRGCPNRCGYCSIPTMYGHGRRYRNLDVVMEEIHQVPKDRIFFTDDDIFGTTEEDKKHAKNLFEKLGKSKKKWASQANMYAANDEELLEPAAKSGCVNLLIGFDSVNKTSLMELNKGINLKSKIGESGEAIQRTVEKCHKYGISVTGVFIFGSDNEDTSIFGQTADIVRRTGVDSSRFEILTPLPGTWLYKRLYDEGRIFDTNFGHYDFSHAVFRPTNTTPEELEKNMLEALGKVSSPQQCIQRAGRTFYNLASHKPWNIKGNLYATGICYVMNRSVGGYARGRLNIQN